MGSLEAALLGLLQGATEFLPVSSSGHLTLAEMALEIDMEDLVALDVALHGATLVAIAAYFGRAWLARLRAEPRLAVLAVAAGVPAGIVYLAAGRAGGAVEAVKGSLWGVGALFMVAGGFLAFASLYSPRLHPRGSDAEAGAIVPRGRRGLVGVAAIGLAQAAAFFPGVSRSGSTMGAGLLVGLSREAAFEFSFLAAAPLLAGALAAKASGVAEAASSSGWALALGGAVAFAVGLAALVALRRVVVKGKLWAFGLYAVVVGVGCLVWAAGRGS